MVTACGNNLGCVLLLFLLVLRLDKASLGSSTLYWVLIVSTCPQLFLDGLQALASAQLIIILLISGIFQYLRHHCRRFGLSTGNTPSFFPQLVPVIALASACAFSLGALSLLRASVNSAPLRASRVFQSSRPSRSSFPCVASVLSASLEAVSAIASAPAVLEHVAQ